MYLVVLEYMFFDKYIDKEIDKFLRERELGYFSIRQKVFLFRELAYLIEGWVAIADAVIIVKGSTDKWSVKKICDEMFEALNKWETLSYSLSGLPRYFNDGDVNIIKSGEESWEMTHVLKYLAEEYEFMHKIKSKYISSMIYPVLLFLIAILAVYLLFTKILPGIFDMVTWFGDINLPPTTKFLIWVTNFLTAHSTNLIVGIILTWLAGGIFFSTEGGKRLLDQYIFQLPLIGKVTQYYDMLKFMRYMRLLMQSWMNFLEVFIFLKDIMGNSSYKIMIEDIIAAINRWERIWSVLEKYTDFVARDVVALLKVWEETASFDKTLNNAIRMYEDEFQKVIDGVSKIIEPVLIVFIWLIVAMVALSVFGIIGTLLDSVSLG